MLQRRTTQHLPIVRATDQMYTHTSTYFIHTKLLNEVPDHRIRHGVGAAAAMAGNAGASHLHRPAHCESAPADTA
ncbi:hypothetical protein [Xanthomonas vesicatoria]|uniref:Uncharacterized protein n=1 Tax=Xanthomonas vesicatoria ATCC 35937 TaxID=925775 RepID=F0B7R8_9XANT|nr:hypothetical protein [Xanthomonas vesicatoria]EGD11604.1 hypothetical protein XVE_0112 [Xanthomonas vesicatoria ATCC 35937]KTF32252.1 hypothetical protein LMG920_13745 [Xanthomonas vesicatoria]MCC8559427.1 hypothetical protein [Xanthomonas vesicatoria]MCC8599081.1 hypothetical protein [Xanthomonas vesicatoria]MCC8602403.1 hypothetical protein [Xanthomonas vesicatoria]